MEWTSFSIGIGVGFVLGWIVGWFVIIVAALLLAKNAKASDQSDGDGGPDDPFSRIGRRNHGLPVPMANEIPEGMPHFVKAQKTENPYDRTNRHRFVKITEKREPEL